MMFALLLVGALLAQSAFAKPTDCGVYCDDQNAIGTSGYATKGGYSSYSKSASYKQYSSNGGYGASNGGYGTTNSGLGATGGRLENFDEGSAIGTIGGDRPGTWADQKHYVTDDGHGEMKYRAGQTVTNNGFSKYAEHSYRYGTHDKHVPTANSQILSTAEFNRELQSIRNRISSFMSTFDFQSGSFVSANMLQDFKNKANVISGQLNNVCDQVDIGSSMHQQMQQMIQQFQHDVEQRQREIEAMIIQSSSSSSVTSEYHTYPTRPSPIQTYPTRPASIQTYPSRPAPVQTYPMPTYQVPTVSESTIMEQRVEEQISQINTLIQNFYSKFNKPEVNSEYQTNLNNQINTIRQKLNELNLQASQYESTRVSFEQLKTQFDSHVTRLQEHIQQLERRQFEVEQQQREAEQRQREAEQRRLEAEQKQRDAELRQLEAEQRQREAELKLQQEKQRQKLILEQEQEKQRQKLILEQEQQKLILLQQQQQLQQQQLQQQQLQQQQQQPVYKPQTNDQVKIEGSYHHSFQSSYGSEGTGATSGSLTHGGHQTYRPEAQVMQPHVDLTAAISRLQQDLHRLQTEVNGFNSYTMRLTASNSANLQVEAQKQADILRQNIKNLCDTSSRYHDQSILSNAENLKRRFEEMFQAFQSQAASYSSGSSFAASAGYSSESSYGGSGRVSSVQAPSIGDVEYTHSKSTDVEIGRRPYSSGSGYSASSGHSSGSSYGSSINDQLSSGLIDLGGGSNSQHVECVEMYAGQPCVEQPRRYKRHVGEGYDDDPFSYQRHRFVIDDFSGYNDRNEEFEPYSPYDFLKDIPDRNEEIEPYSSYDLPNYDTLTTDFNPINHGYSQQIQKSDQLQNQNMQLSRRVQDLTRHRGEIDDYYAEHNQRDHVNGPTTSEPPKLERNIDDSFQQHVNHGENEEYGSFQKPRSQIFKPKPTLPSKNLDSHEDSNNYGQPQNRFNHPNQRENPRVNFKPENVHSQTHYPSTTEKVFIPQHIPLQRKPETVQKPDSFTLQKSGFYDDVDDSQKSESNEESQNSVPLNYENVSRKPTQQLRSEEQTEKPQNVKPIQISEKEESVQKPEDLTLEKSGFDYFPGRSERPIVVIESQSTTPSYYDNKFVTSERTTKKPQNVLPIGTFENSQSIQEPEKFTLEKSGFNDYPSQPEQPKVNDKQEHVKPLITDNLQVSQKTQNLTEQHGLEHSNSRNEKVERPKQFESDLTQQTAGQIDFGPASQVGRQFSSQSITKPERSSQNEKVEKSEESDGDLTQQTSGSIDFGPESSVARQFSSQNIAKIDKFSRDEKIEQLNRDLTQQTSGAINFGPESQTAREFSSQGISKVDKFSRNERVEKPEGYGGDLTQQTAGQIDFGSESQIGRQYFSHGIAKPEAYGVLYKESQHETSTKSPENKQQNEKNNENLSQQHQLTPSNIQIFDSHLPNQQSESISEQTEKNNENSSQHQQILPNIQIFDSHLPNRQSQSINEQTERIGTPGKHQEPISIIHTVPMPAPVPDLIYTRPWQISQLHNIRTQQNNKNVETQNADIDSQDSDYQNDSASHPAPLRGDLPGYTPPSTPAPQPLPSITLPPPTIPPPLPIITPTSTPFPIEEKPTEDSRYNQNGYINYNEKQQYEQVDLNKFNQVHDLPRSRNEWHFNNSEHNYNRFSYTGRGYNFNQQNEYSQRSHYYNQHNSDIDLGQQIQKPFDQQNSYVQLNHQSNPIRYNQRQQSMYQYHEQQTGKLKFEHQQLSNYNLEPTQIPQQSSQILLKRQTDFNQQSELPTFEQQSYQQHVNHQQLEPLSLQQETNQKRLENEFAEEVIPLDNTRSEDQWLEIESTTTPRTFWKRIGHKLSDTYDKAKERAKTIFG